MRPDDGSSAKSVASNAASTGGTPSEPARRANAQPAQPATSANPLPSLGLPKGGGAIRGIGEKFTANTVTGTGTLAVPIHASAGRSKFAPQLSLSYDSGSGNSAFGFGWSNQLPSITRKTDKGLPQYQDAIESDVFILTGSEDLMPGLVLSSGEWIRDITPSRTLYGNQYSIHRYRPRVEGLFARIERWLNLEDPSDMFWRTISAENVTTWYGRTSASRIADPANPAHVFSWLICESYDDKGNAIAYEYKPEDSTGVDSSQVNERNRTDATRAVNRYIKNIFYGNQTPYFPDLTAETETPLPTDWCFQLVFDYGEHDVTNPTPIAVNPWICRLDPFSSYRSTFEVRTYRLCRRALMFHNFPTEPTAGANLLVRSTDLTHASAPPSDPSQPFYSYLLSVTQTGYSPDSKGGYVSSSYPPLQFEYTQAVVNESVQTVDSDSMRNLPFGLDHSNYRWVDLDGEGLSGVLSEQAGSWFYKANLSPVNLQNVNGTPTTLAKFAPVELVARQPSLAALNSSRQRLMDLSGDGMLDLVDFEGPAPGYFERTEDFNWQPLVPFQSLPVIDWQDPQMRFIDLTGDGFADLLITEDDAFWWYQSLSTEGFASGQCVPRATDEEQGPRIIFFDSTESIFLADMSGDGLTDLVRVRNGEVSYWPNLGYGRFGTKITMDNAPLFDRADIFDGRRIRLADIDGSGTADIIYLAAASVQLYFNQSGNGWGAARRLNHFPAIDSLSSVEALDLLGNGTACLVWSSPLPGNDASPMRYIDLMGGQKPHLLISIDNGFGAQTQVQYAPSTKFYVADKLAGTPWVTRLPFPVQVVEQVQTFDYVSRNLFVTCYSYHHGYYDGVEREFRGFGRVDQTDTAELATLTNSTALPAPSNFSASNVPPTLTKTWFHTGAYFGEACVSKQFEQEYYSEGDSAEAIAGLASAEFDAMLLDDTVLPDDIYLPDGTRSAYGLSPEEMREACRALRGSILRQEIYALDGTAQADRPYSCSERNYTLEAFQPQGPNQYGVFFAHARETIDFQYERVLYEVIGNTLTGSPTPPGAKSAADPRVSHTLTLTADPYGNILQSASIGYGRRYLDPALAPADQAMQSAIHATCSANTFTNAILLGDAYRKPIPAQSTTYELIQVQPASAIPGITNVFGFDELTSLVEGLSDGLHDIPFEDVNPSGLIAGQPYRRMIVCTRTYYRPDDMGAAAGDARALLPISTLESLALPGITYKLALTPGLISQVYQRGGSALVPTPSSVFGSLATDGGGYVDVDGDGNWWIPSGRVYYIDIPPATPQEKTQAVANFYLPRRFEDQFGNAATVAFDPHDLLLTTTTDAAGNTVTASNDYRVLAPSLLTDANGNQGAISFDTLGLAVGTALMGKPSQNLGDLLTGFSSDLTQAQVDAFYGAADPHTVAPSLLGNATTRVVYDFLRFYNSRNAAPNDPTQWQPAFAATLAREIHYYDLTTGQQSPIQIHFDYSDGYGRVIQTKSQAEPGPVVDGGPAVNPRWAADGWTIFNNKGKPVRRYEPFFSQLALGHQFEFGITVGVSNILCYDPLERVAATLRPNQTYEKSVFDPWHQASWDTNDTVLITDPTTDPDVGDFFQKLPAADYSPTWYTQRIGGALGVNEQVAATRAAGCAGTPALGYFDSLGRTFLTIENNATGGNYLTHVILDIQGNQRSIVDALSREVMTYDYSMLTTRIHQASMEAGERWNLSDVLGKGIRAWDSRGHNFRTEYDVLRRPLHLFVVGTDATNSDPRTTGGEVMYEKIDYGESQPSPETLNLRTRVFDHYDPAGVVRNAVTNPSTGQSLAYDFKGNLLCSSRQFVEDYKALPNWSAAAPPFLDLLVTSTTYDALNRVVTATTPDSSVVTPTYNEANFLESLQVNVMGTATPTPFVGHIDYNARGQRLSIDYGEAATPLATTTYTFDPLTFRLMQLTTTRPTFPANQQTVQDLSYTYDPVGNITHIEDDADVQNVVFFLNRRVDPSADYTYDAIYRLIQASGREQLGLTGGTPNEPSPETYNDVPRINLLSPSDGNAMGTYNEQYIYDNVGNFLKFIHQGSSPANPGWSRTFTYNEASLLEPGQTSNRLTRSVVSGAVPFNEDYTYDPHGNVLTMPQLEAMKWDFRDELLMTQRQAVNPSDSDGELHQGERTYYVYNASGDRVRKTTESATGVKTDERFYAGTFELYREYSGAGATTVERHTLHVMDDKRRVALVETDTLDPSAPPGSLPSSAIRYQFDNHLGSACLELDDTGAVITYEEYYPFGGTSYQAGRSLAEVSLKRYRYTGKERDEETGLYYQGARYYACWIGRWISCDPRGLVDGPCLYRYCGDNPVKLHDPSGTQTKPAMTGMLANDPRVGKLWEKAVVDTLGKRFNATTYGDVVKAFQAEVARRVAANGGNLGSNRAAGTAINYARELYSQVRAKFGKLAAAEGISLQGLQVHHEFSELAQAPQEALTTTNLMFARGNAGTVGSGHNYAHAVSDAHAAGVKNPGQAVASQMQAQGVKPDVPELAAPVKEEAKAVVKTEVKAEAKVGGEVLEHGAGEVNQLVKQGGEKAVEEGAHVVVQKGGSVVAEKVAKYVPFVGIGVGAALVGNDLSKKDYAGAAWDAGEAVPGFGDIVGIVHFFYWGATKAPEMGRRMYEGQRQRDVERFDQNNPDAPPEAFDQLQRAQEAFDNGQIP